MVYVMLPEGLLEPLFSCGIDAFTYKYRLPAEAYRPGI
jgi:hypothetical protein